MSFYVKKRWRIAPENREVTAALQQSLGCPALVAHLLANRGLTTPEHAHAFLHPTYDALPDPFLLPDAERAAERLKQALHRKERIFVHGDYDGDGVTSAALWTRLLEKLGADVQVHVPHRHRDGYDLRSKFIAQARAENARLILTTDCGIQRCDEVEEAREAGMDVIVTDHHEPGSQLPNAVAVVNPHRHDSRYPFPELAGVGVAFRMGEALVRHLGMSPTTYRNAYSDLAAIGTVTDMMPLIGDNRVIVRHGLEQLQHTKKPGLRALLDAARVNGQEMTAGTVGFVIGPRLNAVGRVDDSRLALDLLLTRDEAKATELASRMEAANVERRSEQQRVTEEAVRAAAQFDLMDTSCLVLAGPWHSGVIGLVASRLMDQFRRPTILIAMDEGSGLGRGSARSLKPFNIHEAIAGCGISLPEFGGHSHAAGLAIWGKDLEAFREAMNRLAAAQLSEEDFVPVVDVEAVVDLCEISPRMMRSLDQFQPWGRGNEMPSFVSHGVKLVDVRRIGKDQAHLKLNVRSEEMPANARLDAVFWRHGDLADHLHTGDTLSLCYRPEWNHYNGSSTVQLVIEDLRPADVDWE